MGEKRCHFLFRHFLWVTLIVIDNEPLDPIYVNLLGADAVVPAPHDVADLIEQFWFVRGRQTRHHRSDGRRSECLSPNRKPVRPENWVSTLLGSKIGSNS